MGKSKMEIKIVEESKNKLIAEIKGESHGFCNAIRNALWNVKGVTISGYNIDHPLVGIPKIIVQTEKDVEPRKVLEKAAKNLKKECDEALKAFEKELK